MKPDVKRLEKRALNALKSFLAAWDRHATDTTLINLMVQRALLAPLPDAGLAPVPGQLPEDLTRAALRFLAARAEYLSALEAQNEG